MEQWAFQSNNHRLVIFLHDLRTKVARECIAVRSGSSTEERIRVDVRAFPVALRIGHDRD